MSFCKSPILCPRSHSSHTQLSTCLGQAAELLTSWVLTCPAGCPSPPGFGNPIHETRVLLSCLISCAGPVTQRGPCVGFCPCSPQPARGGYPNHCLSPPRKAKGGDKGRGHLPSVCAAAVQHPDCLLSRGEARTAARAPGVPLCARPVQALENGVSWQGCLLMIPAEM